MEESFNAGILFWRALPIISTLLGVLIGAFIGEIRDNRSRKKEEKMNLKTTLFLLINIRKFVVKGNLEDLTTKAYDFISSKFSAERDNELIESFVTDLYKLYICNILEGTIYEDLKSIKADYDKSVHVIAKYDPLFAYDITVKNTMTTYLIHFEGYLGKIKNVLDFRNEVKTHSLKNSHNTLLNNVNRELYSEMIDCIDRGIDMISDKLGHKIKEEVSSITKNQSKMSEQDLEDLLNNKGIFNLQIKLSDKIDN